MSRFVTDEATSRFIELMFSEFGDSPVENLFRKELSRYVPQIMGWTDQEIVRWCNYQRSIYCEQEMPTFGVPVASLNPTFSDSIDSIHTAMAGHDVYTRASVKVNGYRLQLHRGVNEVKGFTRQFTPYDFRIFPELTSTIKALPLVIGDSELSNLRYRHLAGFNRVQERLPDVRYWPKKGSAGLDQEIVDEYLSDLGNFAIEEREAFELTLVFHGLFAISDPDTWNLPLEVQAKHLIKLCTLPIDYRRVDELLDRLGEFIKQKGITNASIVEREKITSSPQLKRYLKRAEDAGEEGICVAQTIRANDGHLVVGGRSIKIKKYETIDAVLLGLYLKSGRDLTPDNIIGALLGLRDPSLGLYLPALKVNLDPAGRQIKTDGQRDRLVALTKELIKLVSGRVDPEGKVNTLYEVFLKEGSIILRQLLGDDLSIDMEQLLLDLPRGRDLMSLVNYYLEDTVLFAGPIKKPKADAAFVIKYLEFFQALESLDKVGQRRLGEYFSKAREIKTVSAKLVKPQAVLNLSQPIILEAQVFDAKWGLCPMAAGFHSWYGNSFQLTNCFAERVRHDKADTTDYETIYTLCRLNTVKAKKRRKKSK